MKKTTLLAGAAVASLMLATSAAYAQAGPFQDVPADHWAYSAVDNLQKQKIVIGYPDGTYGGKRAMTRYEFAVAIDRLLRQMPTAVDLTPYAKLTDLEQYAKKSDLAGFARKEDVDTLRRLVQEFETELTTLGVDLDRVKRQLEALEGRVKAIENELKRVQISGEFNFMGRGNHRQGREVRSIRDADGFDVTGGYGTRGSLFADTRVLHDLNLDIKARLSETATAQARLNFGNYLSFLNSIGSYSGARSDRSAIGSFGGQRVNQSQEQSVINAFVTAPIRLPGIGGIDLAVGRLPLQLTPYTLKLIDTDSYFYTSNTDLGDIPVDGAKASLKLGPVAITGFAAKTDPIKYVSDITGRVNGTSGGYGLYAGAGFSPYATFNAGGVNQTTATNGQFQNGFRGNAVGTLDQAGNPTLTGNRPSQSAIAPNRNGAMSVEQLGGVRASIGTGSFGTIGATYIAFSGQSSGGVPTPVGDAGLFSRQDRAYFDRVFLYGADINVNIIGLGVVGSYTVTDTGGNTLNPDGTIDADTETKTDRENYAWDIAATFARGAFSLTGGYKEIAPFFGAPGYWDKIGSFTNPTDIKGPYVTGQYNLSTNTAITASGKFYKGTGDAVDFGGLSEDDEITNIKAGLKFGLTSASSVDLGVERTEYDVLRGAGDRGNPIETFYNIGYGHSFNPATSFKVLYQIVEYRDKNSGFDTQNSRGGVAAAQFSIKF